MTQEQRKIIEDKAVEKFPLIDLNRSMRELHKAQQLIFIKGAEAMGEILQKENAELKEENLKLLKEIERLFVKHGYKITYEVMKAAIKNQK